ncbi:MAG TPA: cysteine peptidase family C39 domain-containing protein [Candidatus Wallbacteria bacterium]|nr:cysteine peptidase family C39 domain-containing protein [Candidatus Wallbacteria bacterium]
MNMAPLYFLANILFFALCFYAGRSAASKGPRFAKFSAFTGLFILALQITLYFNTDIEYKLLGFNDYSYFRWWGVAGAFIITGSGYDEIKKRTPRLPMLYLILTFLVYAFLWRLTIFNTDNEFDQAGFFKGLCLQSTGYTCAPASCVTLLSRFGVKSDEREMAKLCLTQVRGTEYIDIVRGLNLKLDADKYEVRLTRETWNTLGSIPKPFITNIYILDDILHSVTMFDIGTSEVYFADSLAGKFRRLKKDEFLKNWDRFVIYVIKK